MNPSSLSEKKVYDFHDRLNADFPSQILMDITEICNLACTHCPHPDFAKSEHYAARHLDVALNEKMVEEVRCHGQGKTQYIRYAANGEPLVHPHSYEMIETAVKRSGVCVTLTTNGKSLDEIRTRRLLEADIHLIDISLDAYTPETYAAIRVKGDLNVTRNNVIRLINWVRETKARTKVIVSFVEQPQNIHEVDVFEKYWKDQGVDYVVIRRLHSCSGAKISLAAEHLKAQKKVSRRPCLYPWERVVVNARGDLAFCPSDWVHGSYIANYRDTTIKEVWQGEFYRKLRQAHLENNFSQHKFCGGCPDWQQTRWPGEGRSYADMVEDLFVQVV